MVQLLPSLNPDDPVIPLYYPALLVRWLASDGYSLEALLEGTRVSPDALMDDSTLVAFTQHQPLILNALRLTDDPHLGIAFGKRLDLNAMGIVGYAAMACSTLGDALTTIVRYFELRAPLIRPQLYHDASRFEIRFEEALDYGEIRHFMFMSIFSSLVNVLRTLTQEKISFFEAAVPYPEPKDWNQVSHLLDVNVRFDQDRAAIQLNVGDYDYPLNSADPMTASLARHLCDNQLKTRIKREGLLAQLREVILQEAGHFPSLDRAAGELCMSSRTLRRKLSSLGTSYQKQLDSVRLELARQYLQATSIPIAQVAQLLGFEDQSNFGRAFKRWTGYSPSTARENDLVLRQ